MLWSTSHTSPKLSSNLYSPSAEDVYKFIEDDLKAAADVLPQRSQYAATDMGRATRGAALGLLGKVYLYQSKWQEAHDVLQTDFLRYCYGQHPIHQGK